MLDGSVGGCVGDRRTSTLAIHSACHDFTGVLVLENTCLLAHELPQVLPELISKRHVASCPQSPWLQLRIRGDSACQ